MPASAIAIISGSAQSGYLGEPLAQPLVVKVIDENGYAVESQSVAFAITAYPTGATGQALDHATVSTDANGLAQVVLTLGSLPGTYQVQASVVGLSGSPLTFTETGGTIATLADVKAYMGITDTTYDDMLMSWLVMASSAIEHYIQQPVTPRLVTDILDGDGTAKLYMKTGRIVDIYTVPDRASNVQWRAAPTDAWENIVPSDDYIFLDPVDKWSVQLLGYYYFYSGILKNIRVCYTAGFAQTPYDLQKVCIEMVQVMWDESKAGGHPRLGMQTANRGGGGANLGDSFVDMDARWAVRLNKFRRLV